ncbi:MAG: hypothetical protein AAFU71_06660, partial [Cyanobacteria bacterium J06632_22]
MRLGTRLRAQIGTRWGRWLGLLCLCVGVWSCHATADLPPQAVVEHAIALRMAHVQQQLIAH